MGFIYTYQINFIIRILIACICGILIGYERSSRAKEAGIRTHCIVAAASCMLMIISKYGFFDLIQGSYAGFDIKLDPSRMAQGIVTGVGFLGSGMIYHQKGSTQGLTTAAGVWATSGIGMALGAGMYIIGISTTVILLIVQLIFHMKRVGVKKFHSKNLILNEISEIGFQEEVTKNLESIGIIVNSISVSKSGDNLFDYVINVDIPYGISEELLLRQFDGPCALKV